MTTEELNFIEFGQKNPCFGCPAPCCRLQLIPYKAPTTFLDLDYVSYMLLFPRTEVVVSINGDWNILKWEDCHAFEAFTLTCKIHDTPEKPRTCAMYNPYNCWYKKSFVLNEPPQAYRLDLARFNLWVTEVKFSSDGKIMSGPNFERALEILKDQPIEPRIELPVHYSLKSDIRLGKANAAGKNSSSPPAI